MDKLKKPIGFYAKGCPKCAYETRPEARRISIIRKKGSLLDTNPTLAKEWHPTKNGDLKPTEVVANSGKRVWWLGECGHEWATSIYHRNYGTNCPKCTKSKIGK